jgi:hypothetical protein
MDEACSSLGRDENTLRILDGSTPEKKNTSDNISTACTICCNTSEFHIVLIHCVRFVQHSQSTSITSLHSINRFLLQ